MALGNIGQIVKKENFEVCAAASSKMREPRDRRPSEAGVD